VGCHGVRPCPLTSRIAVVVNALACLTTIAGPNVVIFGRIGHVRGPLVFFFCRCVLDKRMKKVEQTLLLKKNDGSFASEWQG
jgi:hypothetical protein